MKIKQTKLIFKKFCDLQNGTVFKCAEGDCVYIKMNATFNKNKETIYNAFCPANGAPCFVNDSENVIPYENAVLDLDA